MYLHLEGLRNLRHQIQLFLDEIKDADKKAINPNNKQELYKAAYAKVYELLKQYADHARNINAEIHKEEDILTAFYNTLKEEVYIPHYRKHDQLPDQAQQLKGMIQSLKQEYREFGSEINDVVKTFEANPIDTKSSTSYKIGSLIRWCNTVEERSKPIADEFKKHIHKLENYRHILEKSVQDVSDFEANLVSWVRAA